MPKKSSKTQASAERRRLKKLVVFEERARDEGHKRIAGLDEVGRGPLAGPLVACACILPKSLYFKGINDSKLLLPAKRNALYQQLINHPDVIYGIGIVSVDIIDKINIYQASLLAMKQALEHLPIEPECLLVDGLKLLYKEIPCEKIIKGDRLSQSIAAASIIAKETRDAIMIQYHEEYPNYYFNEHKGYSTEKHKEALLRHGPCPIHRKSFLPVKDSSTYFLLSPQETIEALPQQVKLMN
jgi:ribonuclease HII